jgi:2-amino-4-hydroxy-6-hydroxymethyldihydropteridine diphosphokinase
MPIQIIIQPPPGNCIKLYVLFPRKRIFLSMTDVVLSLGTNLGDRAQYMRRMEEGLRAILSAPVAVSRLMETEPLGMARGQQWFYNRLMRGLYHGSPHQLLDACRDIEKRLGRERPVKNASRTADIDILLFGKIQLNDARLIVPHPRITDRRFCIEGLLETAPDMNVFPAAGRMRRDVRRQKVRYIETGNDHAA